MLKFTILGCGSSGGVPRPALGWGVCDPNNPKNRRRRTSFLVERQGAERRHARPGRYAAGYARAASGRRGRPARRRALYPRARRPHPRHRRSARALSSSSAQLHRRLSRRAHRRNDARALRLLLQSPPGSEYPPILREHRLSRRRAGHHRRGRAVRSRRCRSCRRTATSPRFGFRFGECRLFVPI